MKPLTSILAIATLCTAVLACAYQPESKRDLLSDSGFRILSLNTPAKVAAFKKLPAHRLTRTTVKGKTVWVYPDQNVCGCLYVGTQVAYDAYIKKATQQMIDTRVNQMNASQDYYNPTAMQESLDWGSGAWDDADAYGLYVN